ncbi:MAG: phosphoenolpyruvate synthase [Bdellovibrionales bacterium GWA2_49_15]|nr:MAG: phosphoenolpyruvate synthase [Bdellovibrionales bacterium GWA2_49_15]HAZ12731.1 phosphoenolpyruvate synthase [Bdellovibrionales bacterium]
MKYIKWFDEVSHKDLALVGGKIASLGEMVQQFRAKEIKIPNGFAITTHAYQHYIKENRLAQVIVDLLGSSKHLNKEVLAERSEKIRSALMNGKLPPDLESEILEGFRQLKDKEGAHISVAVRSSATAEDLPDASFAGQQESYLNIRTETDLLEKCRYCFASLYTDRAVSYRQDKNISQTQISLSVCIQMMVRSDLASSGVLFTLETESGFKDAILINASWGLGENIVKGIVNPDEYVVFKPTLREGRRALLNKKRGGKEFKLIYDRAAGKSLRNVATTVKEQTEYCLSDEEILKLSHQSLIIEDHYSHLKGAPVPMDIEWGKDGITGELYILQARPETVHSQAKGAFLDLYTLKGTGPTLLTGDSIGQKVGQGKVRIIHSLNDLLAFQQGEVLVSEKTEPDWEPYMKKSAAIITDKGGRTCHAAIVGRELGIPAIVGTVKGTSLLKTGQEVTVSCISGDEGFVYEGLIPYEHKTLAVDKIPRPKTKIMLNIANPHTAFKTSFLPNDGVGLARMEFIINNTIKIHPMALIHFDVISKTEVGAKIEKITAGYEDKKQFFVDQLASGIATITAAFYPKDVIVRLSDFKSNEYAHLLGGEVFEEKEENPMIGFRGAARYYHERFAQAFSLECLALQKVRAEMGLTNLKVMVPFCRTVDEGKRVLQEMRKYGLEQHQKGLEVYVMCEIPSNAILAEQFAEIFDGFSIGSNDLTQLTLGVDRDSEILSYLFDENDPAVLQMIQMAIKGAHKKGKKIGLCGQRPSDDPTFARFLIEQGIDSISLNSDAVLKITEVVNAIEGKH